MSDPTTYADHLGSQVANTLGAATRKDLGVFLTPTPIATFMAEQLAGSSDTLRILDPAAGSGVLACAAIEHLVRASYAPIRIHVVAFEVLPAMHEQLIRALENAQAWAAERGAAVTYDAYCDDYIAQYARRPLFQIEDGQFDIVIANPPYFKLGSKDPRTLALSRVVPSQPNIYSLFMTLTARELKPDGEMVYIVPRSFASGVYFKPFRRWFFSCIQPLAIHVFGSRRQAFKRDAVLQENIILYGRKVCQVNPHVAIAMSHSDGVDDLVNPDRWTTPFADLCDQLSVDFVLRMPSSAQDVTLLREIDRLPRTLSTLGMHISTGPVVAFRARDLIVDEASNGTVPLLWMHHVKPGRVTWPALKRTSQYLTTTVPKLLVPMQNQVLLRRFSAKDEPRRLTAAPLLADAFSHQWVGLENHLNYIYRRGAPLSDKEAVGLSAILNSKVMDRYFRCVSGNTQVGAAELRQLPLPGSETIAAIGRKLLEGTIDSHVVDQSLLDEVRNLLDVAAD